MALLDKSPELTVRIYFPSAEMQIPELEEVSQISLGSVLDVNVEKGEEREDNSDNDGDYVHRGIAKRSFMRQFNLSDDIIVKSADLKDGMLIVSLERVIPEEKKPRLIPIGS